MEPKRPSITPAQIPMFLGVIAEGLHAFGVFTLTKAQTTSLTQMATLAVGAGLVDAILRGFRNIGLRPAAVNAPKPSSVVAVAATPVLSSPATPAVTDAPSAPAAAFVPFIVDTTASDANAQDASPAPAVA